MRTQATDGVTTLGAGDDFADRYPELYPNHVAIAACIRRWADGMRPAVERCTGPERVLSEDDYMLGYVRALRDMATLLVDGDGLPDGPFFTPAVAASA